MPDFWEFPTVSMGLTGINSIYQARFNRYMQNRGIKDTSDQRVWAFLGDGEMGEPESLGAIRVAAREELDNLVWVINCNLQQLDGPVTGNGKVIQELESNFRGAGWNVIKVIWGREWDQLLAKDVDGVLVNKMNSTPDGQFQTYSVETGSYVRENFFGSDPRLRKMVEQMSDEQIRKLPRGGHDYRKVYAAFDAATKTAGQPTVILAHTIKGWTIDALEGKNATHQMKKLTMADLKKFRDRLLLPISDKELEATYEQTGAAPFFNPGPESAEIEYMMERRKQLGGPLPERRVEFKPLTLPGDKIYSELKQGSGKNKIASTMATVRLLKDWMRDPEIGKRIVPIAPDEYRTFGMDAMFPSAKVYNPGGQQYESVDRKLLLSYKESAQGQLLHEGISEAGAVASATAAGNGVRDPRRADDPVLHLLLDVRVPAHRRLDLGDGRHDGPRLPDRCHRRPHHADRRGSPARRRALPAARRDQPCCRALRPGVRVRGLHIMQSGLERMYGTSEEHPYGENVIFYLTVYNEPVSQPKEPEGVDAEGILKGIHQVSTADGEGPRVRLLASGVGYPWIEEAARSSMRSGASRPTPGRSPPGTSWLATPSTPSSGASTTRARPRVRRSSPKSWPGPTAPSSRSPTTCGPSRCRSPAGCLTTTAFSAPTGSASPTPARPRVASSRSTPSPSSSRPSWPRPARSTAPW